MTFPAYRRVSGDEHRRGDEAIRSVLGTPHTCSLQSARREIAGPYATRRRGRNPPCLICIYAHKSVGGPPPGPHGHTNDSPDVAVTAHWAGLPSRIKLGTQSSPSIFNSGIGGRSNFARRRSIQLRTQSFPATLNSRWVSRAHIGCDFHAS